MVHITEWNKVTSLITEKYIYFSVASLLLRPDLVFVHLHVDSSVCCLLILASCRFYFLLDSFVCSSFECL